MALIDEVRVLEGGDVLDMAGFEGVFIARIGKSLSIQESENPDMSGARSMQGEPVVKGSLCYGDVYRPSRRYLQIEGGQPGVCLQYGVRFNPGSIERDWNAGKFVSPAEPVTAPLPESEIKPQPEPPPAIPHAPTMPHAPAHHGSAHNHPRK